MALPFSCNRQHIPVQRHGYRYVMARPADLAAPGGLYEEDHHGGRVALSLHDRSREIDLDMEGRVTCAGGLVGYRSVMATHGLAEYGSYYFEVVLEAPVEAHGQSHVRLGVARMGANLHGPVGMDSLGFCFADDGGTVHAGRKTRLPGSRGFAVGDRVGCLLEARAPPDGAPFPAAEPEGVLVDYYRQAYFEYKIPPPDAAEAPWDGRLGFYVNGELRATCAGPWRGVLYPMISLYRGARATFVAERSELQHLPAGARPWDDLFRCRQVRWQALAPLVAAPAQPDGNPACAGQGAAAGPVADPGEACTGTLASTPSLHAQTQMEPAGDAQQAGGAAMSGAARPEATRSGADGPSPALSGERPAGEVRAGAALQTGVSVSKRPLAPEQMGACRPASQLQRLAPRIPGIMTALGTIPGRPPPAAQQPERAAGAQLGEAAGFEAGRELADLGEARISQPCEN